APERRDRGHVGGPEEPVRLHEDGHLPAVGAPPVAAPVADTLVADPAQMHDRVNGAVDDLRRPLVLDEVQRRERESLEARARLRLTQVRGHPVAECRAWRAIADVLTVPPERPPDRP